MKEIVTACRFRKVGCLLAIGAIMVAGGCATTGNTKAPTPAEAVQSAKPLVGTAVIYPKHPELTEVEKQNIQKLNPKSILVFTTHRLAGEWIGFINRFYIDEWQRFIMESANKYKNGDFGTGSKSTQIGYYQSAKLKEIVMFMKGADLQVDLKSAYEADHAGK